ncbi:MAG: VOC family protein, partial [Bdellovibrionales bacterium]|nr:VOC family protein [Bdellovibrionales bacterium]
KQFYSDLLGWTYDQPTHMQGYTVIKNQGRSNGGIMQLTPEMQGFPPNWTVYFTVQDLDQSIAKVKQLGGQVRMTMPISIGKIAMITDPTGAFIMLIQMDGTPEEWPEE